MGTPFQKWTDIKFEDVEITLESIPAEDGGGWRAWVREFGKHGLMGDGDTPEEAVAMLQQEMPDFLKQMNAAGVAIPDLTRTDQWSGRILVRVPSYLHRQLVRDAAREGTSLNTYLVSLLSGGTAWTRVDPSCGRQPEKQRPERCEVRLDWSESYDLAA